MPTSDALRFDTGPLRKAIEKASAELQARASDAIEAWATAAAAAARQTLSVGTQAPHQRETVRMRMQAPLRAQVGVNAKHAHIVERGTVKRRTRSRGANRGVMKAQNRFVPLMIDYRGRMIYQLERLIPNKDLV